MDMRIGILALVVSSVVSIAAAQQQPPRQPFIEPAEHRHALRAERPRAAAPSRTGEWTALSVVMPINPVHVALMHDGKVLVIAGSGNDPDNHDLQAAVWNPATRTVRTFKIYFDMFCNGMVVLPDGHPFVMGGTIQYSPPAAFWIGDKKTASFNPSTEMFTDKASMNGGRWYPTGTVLADGTVLAISGLDVGGFNDTIEIYHPSTNTWTHSGSGFPGMPLYPRMALLPNGKVFESGSNPNTKTYEPATGTWRNVATTLFGQYREYGTSVLLPLLPSRNFAPRVMILGGGPQLEQDVPILATDTTEIIDLSAATPAWTAGPNMAAARIQLNATLLPGGRVLVSGGSSTDEEGSTAVREAELYDPATNAFSSAETMNFPRLYHSNTLLLPDATVLAVGGNPARGDYEPHIEIYTPPYLFKADGTRAARPEISSSTTKTIHYGASFEIHTHQAADIRRVELIRAGAVTHAFDMDQRLVGLTYTTAKGVLHAKAPATANLAPPGYYLLFAIDKNGVPSVAHWVHLTASAKKHY
jgi:hypothetical protein